MKTIARFLATAAALAVLAAGVSAKAPSGGEEPEYTELPGPGKTCRIGEAYTFTYEFDKKPKMGMIVVKIKLFDKSGARTTELGIVGRSGMPSMGSAHDSGDVAFKLNQKGDYLMPVNVVMPGDWEVRLVFMRGEEVVFRGALKFDV